MVKHSAARIDPSTQPFGRALRALLEGDERFLTLTGNINFRKVAELLPTTHYETLRKAVTGDRPATPEFIEEVAGALGVDPDYFVEWRLDQARKRFDVREVGFDQALSNLSAWSEANGKLVDRG